MQESGEWLTTKQAAALTGYTTARLRQLSIEGEIQAQKWGRDWMINRDSLLAYKAKMDALSEAEKRNPWRPDLWDKGKGRKPEDKE